MSISDLRNSLRSAIDISHRHDSLVLIVGIAALVLGLLVDVFVVRLICLLLVLSSAALVFLFTRGVDSAGGSQGNEQSHYHSHSETDEMKKLLFDDFQPDAGGRYIIEEVQGEGAGLPPSPEDEGPSGGSSFAPAIKSFVTMKPETKQPPKEFQFSDFFDVDSEFFKGGAEPKTEFNFLITRLLSIIKETVFAHSVAFFWANREKGQMVLEAKLSDSAGFMTARRFPVDHDLVSKVASSGRPELVTDVNPVSERELLRYYEVPVHVRSFVGVPVFYLTSAGEPSATMPVGVIAIDSTAEGAFGEETLTLLGQFTKLASGLIKSYTDKYDLLRDSELRVSMRRMQDRLQTDFSQQSIINSLTDEVSKLVSWDFISVVLFDEVSKTWRVKKVVNRSHDPYIAYEQDIDFPDSIVGSTIKNNLAYLAESFSGVTLPTFAKGESLKRSGSLLSIPLSSLNKCYGALTIESSQPGNYTRQDSDLLRHLAGYTASALEIVYLNEIIVEYVIVDDATGLYSKKFFFQRLREELQRADEQSTELSMLLITVDHAMDLAHRYHKDGYDRIMLSVAKAIRGSIRVYDLVGRFDQHKFAVVLVHTAANDAYLWAEKIRKHVSSNVIALDGKSFSITISVGVCGALEGMRADELVGNTITVLQKATENGGNAVRVF